MSRNEYFKRWRELNKEKVKAYKATYYQDNKEIICEDRKQYYDDNREIILQKQQEKGAVELYKQGYRECDCGKTLKISSFYQHRKNNCPKNKNKNKTPYIKSLLLDQPICLDTDEISMLNTM